MRGNGGVIHEFVLYRYSFKVLLQNNIPIRNQFYSAPVRIREVGTIEVVDQRVGDNNATAKEQSKERWILMSP